MLLTAGSRVDNSLPGSNFVALHTWKRYSSPSARARLTTAFRADALVVRLFTYNVVAFDPRDRLLAKVFMLLRFVAMFSGPSKRLTLMIVLAVQLTQQPVMQADPKGDELIARYLKASVRREAILTMEADYQ